MKERYEEAIVEVIEIEVDDVIVTSGPTTVMDDDGTLPFIDIG